MKLNSRDLFHIQAAKGWLELGNDVEADAELDRIGSASLMHPEVLKVRWQICANANKWDSALQISEALMTLAPQAPLAWLYRSDCLCELNRTTEARDNLLTAEMLFSPNPEIYYDLACYDCRLGQLESAWKYLEKAFELRTDTNAKLAALMDSDLEPLWPQIVRFS